MKKKWISLFTLLSFLNFSFACVIYKSQKVRGQDLNPAAKEKVEILAVLTTSGKRYEFPKKHPGIIQSDMIFSRELSEKTIVFDKSEVGKVSHDRNGDIEEITTKDGRVFGIEAGRLEEEGNKYFITLFEPVSIPLSEVELLWIKKADPGLTFLAVVGGVAVTVGVLFLIVLLTKESCPFIYSFDGEQYVFDAEPYGGAICQGLKRTEWCALDYIEEVDGQYKILITNEVDETQYTDEVKLIVVDHPKGVDIIPEVMGEMHTFNQPILPLSAVDGSGKDLMPYIADNDWIFWQSSTAGRNPDSDQDLRDELNFEFPKPRDAKTAKLLVNACTTLWGSQMLKRFLDLFGNTVGEWYAEIDNRGPAYDRQLDLRTRGERYALQIRVETEDGWQTKGHILGGGPFVSEDRAYILDISDVPGDTIKLKLTPPPTFWMINHLAVDYSADVPIQITELEAMSAVDWKGQDVREALAFEDNVYLVMPETGDKAELVFQSFPQDPNFERSIILKASGYYDIHLKAEGEPETETLIKFMFDPEYMNRYALKEYLKWQKENVERRDIR